MVYLFAERFWPLVESGAKRQTIRAAGRRRPPAPGEPLSLRRWTGKAYRSPQEVLRVALCVAVRSIRIDDGFADGVDMAEWWRRDHTFPFDGRLILWRV